LQARCRGFESLRLHSTRCARSWQAIRLHVDNSLVCYWEGSESNVLSERSESKDQSAPSWAFLLYFIYILECSDGSFYVGSTSDVDARLDTHQSGNGPAYTARRLPVRLLYSESHSTLQSAICRERQLKRWSSAKKAALVAGDRAHLHELSKCRQLHGNLDDHYE
jgi:putative endonuclease